MYTDFKSIKKKKRMLNNNNETKKLLSYRLHGMELGTGARPELEPGLT